jgi:transcriptional regulator with PAS, ATPase and Fis domain
MISNSVGMECQVQIRPVFGRKREIMLNRTNYQIRLVARPVCELHGCDWILGGIGDDTNGISITWTGIHYECRSTTEGPFKLNNVWCYHALLCLGDVLDLGRNILYFQKKNQFQNNESENEIVEFCQKLPRNNSVPILIEGETGVGKGHLARCLHDYWNSQTQAPFIQLNLAGLPEGLLESELFGHQRGAFTGAIQGFSGALVKAHGGTLFLDEIDSLPLQVQLKLLLFLDHRKVRSLGSTSETAVDLKLIIATGQSLEKIIESGQLRRDFYYRISSGARVFLPSLRERPEKIEQFIKSYLGERKLYIDSKLMKYYAQLPWPGNYRQLKGHLDLKISCAKNEKIIQDHWDELLIDQMSELKMTNHIQTLREVKSQYAMKVYRQLNKKADLSAKALGICHGTLKALLTQP